MRALSLVFRASKTGRPPHQPKKRRPFWQLKLRWQSIIIWSNWLFWTALLEMLSQLTTSHTFAPFPLDALDAPSVLSSDVTGDVIALIVGIVMTVGGIMLLHRLFDALGWTRYRPEANRDGPVRFA